MRIATVTNPTNVPSLHGEFKSRREREIHLFPANSRASRNDISEFVPPRATISSCSRLIVLQPTTWHVYIRVYRRKRIARSGFYLVRSCVSNNLGRGAIVRRAVVSCTFRCVCESVCGKKSTYTRVREKRSTHFNVRSPIFVPSYASPCVRLHITCAYTSALFANHTYLATNGRRSAVDSQRK